MLGPLFAGVRRSCTWSRPASHACRSHDSRGVFRDKNTHPQEVGNVGAEEAISWLEAPRHPQTQAALEALRQRHGKTVGHAGKIVDAAFSGELLATKDAKCMRLWRARDGTLLRVVSACPGDGVAFAPNGQNIATGSVKLSRVQIWGPAGGSAVGCGKTKITHGKA